MGYTVYESASRSLRDALDILQSLRTRRAITATTAEDIRLSRRARTLSAQTAFLELQQAFITPIDREDLLELRQLADAVHRAAEDVVLALYAHGLSAPSPDDTAALSAAVQECTLLYEAVESLQTYPRSDTVVQKLTAAEQQHWQRQDLDRSPTRRALVHFGNTCFTAAERLRRILLKMV